MSLASLKTVLTNQYTNVNDEVWLPAGLMPLSVLGKSSIVWNERFTGWDHAEPEWINETIDRLSRLHVVDREIPGPPCRMISLVEAEQHHNEWIDYRIKEKR